MIKYLSIVTIVAALLVYILVFHNLEIYGKGLYFVDAGRFALVARSLVDNGEFYTKFNFYTLESPSADGWVSLLPPIHITMIALFMKIFGVNDQAVIIESFTFYILTAVFTFLLAKKIFNKEVALFSLLFTIFNPQLIGYAKDGASEPLFIFLLLSGTYFMYLQKRWSYLLSGLIFAIALFTKLQSYILIPFFIVWIFMLTRKIKDVLIFIAPLLLLFILNKAGLLFSYYYIWLPTYLLLQQSSVYPGDNITRSLSVTNPNELIVANIKEVLSKIFYNLYNFYKVLFNLDSALPNFTIPLINIGYLLSNILIFTKENIEKTTFRVFSLLMLIGLIILSSATSPQIRYIHIMVPFITILAVDLLYQFISFAGSKVNLVKKETFIISIMTGIFILSFVLPFVGKALLDSRFESRIYNVNKPYVGKVLGERLKNITVANSKSVTNLHTWGSWYGDRITMLIPINFENFKLADEKIAFDYIYLTDYQRNNEDRPLNGGWGILFDHPHLINDQYLLSNFRLIKEGTISANEVYENQQYIYKLWVHKRNLDEKEISKIY